MKALWAFDVLQPMAAQVTHSDVGRHYALCTRMRRVRDEHLPAAAGRGDSCGAVHIEPNVFPITQAALTAAKAKPHADHLSFRPGVARKTTLNLDRGAQPSCRGWED